VPTIPRRSLRTALPLLLFGGTVATAGAQEGQPLAQFAAQKVAVYPIQFLRNDTTAPVRQADWPNVRKEFDDSLGAAIAERGVGKKWTYAPDLIRLAKRNAGYVSDPSTLGAGGLRPPRPLKADDQAGPTLVSNLRSLTALGDARIAMVPVELGFEKKGADVRATLRVVLIDSLAGQVIWYIDLAVPTGTSFGHAGVSALAQRVADLVAPR
jgi:hypothetical protein